MSSEITNNSGSIDAGFPVAGQDNDTAGFRNNFSNIKSAFQTASTEISKLQQYAVLKGTLATPSESVINDLGGSTIDNAIFSRFYGQAYISPAIGTSTNVDLADGHFQIFPVSAGLTLNFVNWPESGQYAKITLILSSSNGNSHNISFSTTGGTIVKGNTPSGNGFPVPFTVPYVVEAYSRTSANTQPILSLADVSNIQPGCMTNAEFSIVADTVVESVNPNDNTVTLADNIVSTQVGTVSANGVNSNLAGVSIVGTSGQFICKKTVLSVGEKIVVSGTILNPPTITGVTITSTSGEFTCSPTDLRIGQAVTLTGTLSGSGSITGYTTPDTYYIIDTNGTTIFQLSATPGGSGLTTTTGTTTGITFTKEYVSGYVGATKNYYIIETNGTSTFTLSESVDGDPITTVIGTPAGLAFGTGTVTLTFQNTTGVIPFNVGQTITVSGMTPTGYNGTYKVTNATETTVSYKGRGTGAQTVAGFVTYNGISNNVPVTFTYDGPRVVEAWTYNGGSTVYMALVGDY